MTTEAIEIKDMFSAKFCKQVKASLNESCANGQSTSIEALCNKLGLTEDLGPEPETKAAKKVDPNRGARNQALNVRQSVALAIRSDCVSGYTISPGRGVHDPNVESPKGRKSFPEGFVEKANKTLARLCKAAEEMDKPKWPTRRTVVEAMDQAGSHSEAYLADALKQGLIPGYQSAKGRGILTQAAWDALPKSEASENADSAS